MKIIKFANLLAEAARRKGFRAKAWSIVQGMGYSQDAPYNILYRFEQLGILRICNSNIILTEDGEKFLEKVFYLAKIVKNNTVGYENDTGRVIGNILYALADWSHKMRSSNDLLRYADELIRKIKELEKIDVELYKHYIFLLPRYHYEAFEDPLTLLEILVSSKRKS
ncbi:MAG: hypothetical protein DRO01_04150 [Thermoproteota archaeon]|nr:MAG: hypothetical protein DRO01_04150 [Candidatus Korarchaeota archaeon]